MRKFKFTQFRCLRCGHKWTPRQENVRICPKCKSASWDTAKDGALKPSGIRVEGRKIWLRVSDSYSAEQRAQVEKQLDSFEAWLKRNDEGGPDA